MPTATNANNNSTNYLEKGGGRTTTTRTTNQTQTLFTSRALGKCSFLLSETNRNRCVLWGRRSVRPVRRLSHCERGRPAGPLGVNFLN